MEKRLHNDPALKGRRRALRTEGTKAEAYLWTFLKRRQVRGQKFRRQHSIGPFVVDFYCPAAQLAIEVDGSAHDAPNRAAYDAERQAYLQAHDVTVLRFSNDEVLRDIERVVEAIGYTLDRKPSQPSE